MNTPTLPGFQTLFRGRKNISSKQQMARKVEQIKTSSLVEVRRVFAPFIPTRLFDDSRNSGFIRNRVFNLECTFLAFFNQVIQSSSCAETVKMVQAWCASKKRQVPSSNTGAYCRARIRLKLPFLHDVFEHVKRVLGESENKSCQWCGRSVKVVDGTGLSMPDTEANQKAFPQNKAMTKGCGFPQMSLVGIFSLTTGALLDWESGNKHDSEKSLFKRLWPSLSRGDVVLGDRGFCTYANIAGLSKMGVDSVFRLHAMRKVNFRRGRKVGKRDAVFTWDKPKTQSKVCDKTEWRTIPDSVEVRVTEVSLKRKGFRTEKVMVATTLLDSKRYPALELSKLYLRRWKVELYLRDIKTTLGMDILSSKTPKQIEKEVAVYMIAYNIIRGMIINSSSGNGVTADRVSFSGTVAQIKQWLPYLIQANSHRQFLDLLHEFRQRVTQCLVPERPGRCEPRVKKRRPKNYKIMNKPREQMVTDCHRNRPEKKNAFFKP